MSVNFAFAVGLYRTAARDAWLSLPFITFGFSHKSIKFELNINIIDMTPLMTTLHYVFQSDGTLLWIIILMGAAIFAFAAVIICVRAVKYMIIELYEGIKFTIEYWRDKDGRENGMYN